MANHKSSLKRIRQDKKKALHNHYYAKTMRNAVRKLRAMTNKDEATALYPKVQKMLDKLAKIMTRHGKHGPCCNHVPPLSATGKHIVDIFKSGKSHSYADGIDDTVKSFVEIAVFP